MTYKSDLSRKGFTLIQLSILLTVAALVLVAILPSTRTAMNANNATNAKMNTVLTALRQYESKTATLPCPADASLPIGSASYGVAAANPGTGTNCSGGSPAANYVDAANNVAIGAVPVRALGLSNDYAVDAYGRDITYAVDTNATVCFLGTLSGKIAVTDNGTVNTSVIALLSHGADGHGAWIPLTGSSGAAVRLNAGSTDTDQHLVNAHGLSGGGFPANYAGITSLVTTAESTTSTFVNKLPTATFDDLIVYKNNLWNINSSPAAASSIFPSVSGPSSGSYFTGNTLTFTVTFSNTVTITGTPELTLGIPQQSGSTATRYATYASSSGSTATFTYTVQSTDYVPSSLTSILASSPILLNGGTISVNGVTPCLAFSPPSLTGVLLNPIVIYVTDSGNGRVEQFNGSGTYLSQFSSAIGPNDIQKDSSGNLYVPLYNKNVVTKYNSSGTVLLNFGAGFNGVAGTQYNSGSGNGQLNSPAAVAIDASGNVWVADLGNNRVQEFNSSGAWVRSIGGPSPYTCETAPAGSSPSCASGSGNGQFSGPGGIAIDPSGNIWVVDSGNYRIQEFNSSGVYQTQFGSYGAGGGHFVSPDGIAIDASGNIFTTDGNGDTYIQEFSNSGVYMGEFGSTGSGNGQIGASGSQAGRIAIDSGGNIWIADIVNSRVEEFSSCGTYLSQFGSSGTGNGQFTSPLGIALNVTAGGTGACISSVTPPSNGAYTTGQTLTFTVNYNAAVTVTGTPQLTLTVGSNTRYANYVSGSGTTTLTFSYTIQASDSATSISAGSSINLNGGTITNGSASTSASLTFTLSTLGGITVNATSFMLVADTNDNRVEKLDLDGNYISQIGSCSSGACSSGSSNGQFNLPAYATPDSSGNIWVFDNYNNRLQEFSSAGNYLAKFTNSFSSPYGGLAIDSSGNIWATDYNNRRVQELNSSGTFVRQLGTTGTTACTSNLFSGPVYVHLDSSGNVYVSDTVCAEVQEFNSTGTYIKTFGPSISGYGTMATGLHDFAFDACGDIWLQDAGNGHLLETDYEGNFIKYISPVGGEQSIAIDGTGKIYSLDASNNVIYTFNSSGTYLSTLDSSGSGNGQFTSPLGISLVGTAVTRLGISSCSAVITSAAGPPNGTYTTGSTLGFAVTYDQAVTVTGTPQISITIGNNTRTASYVSGSGSATLTFQYTVAATDTAQPGVGITMSVPISLNSGTITSNSIASGLYFQPPSLTAVLVNPVTSYSNFYIADTSNHVVRKVTQSTGYISTVAGTGTSGSVTAGTATSSKLNAPTGVALDGSGNLYIADTGDHAVLKVTTGGTLSYFAGTGTSGTVTAGTATSSKLNAPAGVAFDSSGNAYIADGSNHEVLKVTSGGVLSVFAGTGTSGTVTAGAATSSNLNSPTGVAVDSSNNVYIADGSNHEVLKVTSAGTLSIFAGTGTSGSTNDNNGSAATSALLKTPYGLAVDGSNNLYIADSGNDTILEVTASTGKIAIIAGVTGSASYTGDGSTATSAKVSAAKGVAVDASGNVYIADTSNNRIRFIQISNGDIYTLAGNGTGAYAGDGSYAATAEIKAPAGVAVSR
jgi:sugar lactone lactonase YvrE/type II secretory pathway pseudopilin PulG